MEQITIDEVRQRLNKKQPIELVDVREPDEVKEFNIGGLHVPLGKIQSMQVDDLIDMKDEEVVLYCRSGNRSTQACLILETMGFKNVKNLQGGMLAWREKFGDVKQL
ncbi:MAG TPA: rhodanese-like domain-containing protein [Flavitalea sp.]|nr:rhodanese-like domain-containing protein [Flavitalea sp.]